MTRGIEHEPLGLDDVLAVAVGRTPQHCVDARQELTRGERFRDVVIRPAIETHDLVVLLGARGEHDDGNVLRFLVALERARQLETAHVRQHPVDEHEIGALIGDARARFGHVRRFAHLESAAPQPERDHLANGLLIFDDQNLLCCHRPS